MENTLKEIADKYKKEGVKDFSELLFLFKLKGKPCSLDRHHIFQPAYFAEQPKRSAWKVARQLGKTTNAIALPNLLRSILINGWTTLTVTPRFEQVKRISQEFIDSFIKSSDFKDIFCDSDSKKNVLTKTFSNGSTMYFSYAFLDCGRIRGIPGVDDWKIDEVQDFNPEFITVIRETASATEFGLETFCGTPLTFDGPLELLWQQGTQSELVVTCTGCNTENIPAIEFDLEKMIGKKGAVCKSCGKMLDVYNSRWVARYPDKKHDMVSRHLPQVVSPVHHGDEDKWNDLLYKIKNYHTAELYNEVFGESYDTADKLFSVQDLIDVAKGVKYDLATAKKRAGQLRNVGIGVDWTGGGLGSDSYTSVIIGGQVPGKDLLEVVYTVKLPKNINPSEECDIILNLKKEFKARWIAHDYGGAGRSIEWLLLQKGLNQTQVIPLSYVPGSGKEIVYPNNIEGEGRRCYNVDKTRSIVVLSTMMKAGKIVLPDWKTLDNNDKGNPFRDMLNIFTEQKQSLRGSDFYNITKTAGTSDDTAHALNFFCTASWVMSGSYPNVAEAQKMKMTKEQIKEICPTEADWNTDK